MKLFIRTLLTSPNYFFRPKKTMEFTTSEQFHNPSTIELGTSLRQLLTTVISIYLTYALLNLFISTALAPFRIAFGLLYFLIRLLILLPLRICNLIWSFRPIQYLLVFFIIYVIIVTHLQPKLETKYR